MLMDDWGNWLRSFLKKEVFPDALPPEIPTIYGLELIGRKTKDKEAQFRVFYDSNF